jgi:tetratricopeptide (TPR) repeat protein
MATAEKHRWQFAARFRRNAFGWRSQPAIGRVQEAVAEIRKVKRKAPVLAAEGAVLFLERVSSALEQVDSSSGAIGNVVNRAIEELVPVIAQAPADGRTRIRWLERLWEAYTADQIPYIETLGDFWGDLCASRELASSWADFLIAGLRENWEDRERHRGRYFHGTSVCLSSLLEAGRYQELLELLDKAPFVWWEDRRWGVKALAAMGKKAEAIAYAEASRGLNDDPGAIARVCESLLSMGQTEEAYERYAIAANRSASYLATYRAIVRKYPYKPPVEILRDLIRSTPGEEGKWFATAKEAGLLELAVELANRSPSDPRTLIRASRDFMDKNPAFALEAGLAALRWLGQGYGYEIIGADVWPAYSHTMQAAERLGRREEIRARIRELAANAGFVADVLGRELGTGGQPGTSRKS